MRYVVALLLAVATVGACADSASAWSGSIFSSPTGNLRCRYYGGDQALFCRSMNDGFTIWLGRYGRPATRRYGPAIGRGHYFAYGETWTAPGFSCNSQITGITCRNPNGHGFFLNRTND